MAQHLLNEADGNFSNKLYEKAEAQYTKLIDEYRNNCNNKEVKHCVSQAYNNRGQIKYLRVDFAKAIDDYSEALLLNKSEVYLYNRGLIHYRLGRYTLAIADFTEALKIKPDFLDSITALKTAQFEQVEKGDQLL